MNPFTRLRAPLVALPLANVDTDQIIPARFLNTPREHGYGGFLLHDLRQSMPELDAALARGDGAKILVTKRNFGCGSSREAAVYALADAGVRCVISPSFGDIFAGNAVNNGILPARVDEEVVERLLAGGARRDASVDLESRTIAHGSSSFGFSLDEVGRTKLLNGWDDVDLALSYRSEAVRFAEARALDAPWSSIDWS